MNRVAFINIYIDLLLFFNCYDWFCKFCIVKLLCSNHSSQPHTYNPDCDSQINKSQCLYPCQLVVNETELSLHDFKQSTSKVYILKKESEKDSQRTSPDCLILRSMDEL